MIRGIAQALDLAPNVTSRKINACENNADALTNLKADLYRKLNEKAGA